MARVCLFQHVPFEPLGILSPLIRDRGHRVRYVNFSREPDAKPNVKKYDALIILGGPANVDQTDKYPHLQIEIDAIKHAIDANMPILGICLGAQLLAHALGGHVGPGPCKEVGWAALTPTPAGQQDRLIQHWAPVEPIFQWHSYTFEIPTGAEHLVEGDAIGNQAFRYGDKAYGFQFHLEVNEPLIQRWVSLPLYQSDLDPMDRQAHQAQILQETKLNIERSLALGEQVFSSFLDLLPSVDRKIILPTR